MRRKHLFEDDDPSRQEGEEPRDEGDRSEEVVRLAGEATQELRRHQVQQHAQRPGETVLRLAETTRMVVDFKLGDRGPRPGGIRRNKTMHLTVKANGVDDLATVCLERATVVVEIEIGRASCRERG